VFRIVQESLPTWQARPGAPGEVELKPEGSYLLLGCRTTASASAPRRGKPQSLGLVGLRERAH
jgi:hypothetical protein